MFLHVQAPIEVTTFPFQWSPRGAFSSSAALQPCLPLIAARAMPVQLRCDGRVSRQIIRFVRNTHEQGVATLVDMPKLHSSRPAPHTWVDHSTTVLQDGSLLAGLHGFFENDVKVRTFVVRSIDRGDTWHYLSTVAFDLDPGFDRRLNGFCEPGLLVLPSGEILCFIRSGGTWNSTFTPLYLSRSIDGGQSWSHADEIADRGVWPNACRMASGVLVVAYGRTGDWLAFSLDEGHHWIGHFCYYHGPQSLDGCTHSWVEEVAPDMLMVAYSRSDLRDPCQSEILGSFMQVHRGS